jgi:Mce-associated membrane protein
VAEVNPAPTAVEATAARRRRPVLLAVGAALLAAATVFTAWAGWSWYSAAQDESLAFVSARDDALRAGREHLAQLTTLDHHDVDAGIRRWLDVSTGSLHDELTDTDDTTRATLRAGGAVSTGTVLDAAISELDQRTGTARMLASVEITVTKAGEAPATKRNRFVAQLTRTDAGWKLSAIDQVPLGTR